MMVVHPSALRELFRISDFPLYPFLWSISLTQCLTINSFHINGVTFHEYTLPPKQLKSFDLKSFAYMKNFQAIWIVSFNFVWSVWGLTCVDVKETGSGSQFSLEMLKTLSDDFTSCLVFLGKDPLGHQEARYLWMRLIETYDGDIANIPDSELQQLGWIMKAISPKDMKNLTLDNIDTIAAFGKYHNLSRIQLQTLAERVREDWSSKEPTDYTFYDLMALNHILCGFNVSDIAMIHPDAYKEAANMLSTLQDCPRESLEALASLAVSYTAFDQPSTWHSSQVKSVGCVLNGFPSEVIASIPPEGMESLTPDIIPCLFKETLKAMTTWQLNHLTPSAAGALSHDQKSFLGFYQQRAVNEAQTGKIGNRNSGESAFTNTWCMIIIIFLREFVNNR